MNQYGNNQNSNYVPGQPISIPSQNVMNQYGNSFQPQPNNNGYNHNYSGNPMIQIQQPIQNQQPQMNQPQQEQKKPSVWYRAISKADYQKINEMGSVDIIVRFLPGINTNGIYESIFEKNTSASPYPNNKRWIVPLLVISDPLHPQLNGFVGVFEFSKTLYNQIKNKVTPNNYYDFNTGRNFHIVVSLQATRDGNEVFPNYRKSGFEEQSTQCDYNYVGPKMKEGGFADFFMFVQKINNPQQKNQNQQNVPQIPQNNGYVQTINSQMNNQQIPQQYVQNNQSQVMNNQYSPQNQQPNMAPSIQQLPQNQGTEEEFNQIFGN